MDRHFWKRPEIHLPPQPVFPASTRDDSLGLTASEEQRSEGPEAQEGEEHGFTPLGMTEIAITNTLLSAWLASIVLVLFLVLGVPPKKSGAGAFFRA